MAFPFLSNMECSETTTHKYSTANNVYSDIEVNLIYSNKTIINIMIFTITKIIVLIKKTFKMCYMHMLMFL